MSTKTETIAHMSVVEQKKNKSKDWYAWNDLMPPAPNEFHLVGRVLVGNPGIIGEIRYREPQGIVGTNLLLDLFLIQRPGIWPQVKTWISVRYDEGPSLQIYAQASVYSGDSLVAEVPVVNASLQ